MLDQSTIMNEVKKITALGATDSHFLYTCRFQLSDGSTVDPLKFVSLDVVRDFTTNYADVTVLEVVFGMGTYTKKLFPFRTNLQVHITREAIGEVQDTVNADSAVEEFTYTAILMDPRGHAMEQTSHLLDTKDLGDLGGISKVQFQLIEPVSEWMRSESTGGIFKQCTPFQCLQVLLTKASKEMPVARNITVDSINLIDPDNYDARDHIVVPQGTPLLDLPHYLQEKCGGIYNAEIGFYLHKGSWYVWPLFNTQRFENSPTGLTVVNIPEDRMPGLERTYRTTANQVIILTTGGTRSVDTSHHRQVDEGNGIRFTDAKSIFEGFASVKDNIATLSRGKNVTEVLFKTAENGLNHVVNAAKNIGSNMMSQLSKTAVRQGQVVQTAWENSRGGLIYPGMPVRYLYENDNVTKTRHGVVTKVQDFIHLKGEGSTQRRYTSNTSLTLFLEINEDDDVDTAEASG